MFDIPPGAKILCSKARKGFFDPTQQCIEWSTPLKNTVMFVIEIPLDQVNGVQMCLNELGKTNHVVQINLLDSAFTIRQFAHDSARIYRETKALLHAADIEPTEEYELDDLWEQSESPTDDWNLEFLPDDDEDNVSFA